MSRARAVVSAVAVVLAVVCLPLSILSVWARVQLVDEEAFTATLAPLARSTVVQDAVIAASTDAVDAKLDTSALAGSVVDGIIALGVGDRAADALRRLQAPAAAAVQTLVHDAIAEAIRSDTFAAVWDEVLRQSHRALKLAATADGAGVVVQTDAGLGVQVGAVVAGVKERLSARDVAWATLIPSVDHVVIIGSGDALAAVRTGYALGVNAGWWMPVATAILFLAGIALARRRVDTLRWAALGAAAALGALLIAAAVGRAAVSTAAAGTALTPAAAVAIYDQLLSAVVDASGVALAIALAVAAGAWLAGPSTPAVAVRHAWRRWGLRRAVATASSD
ncbi:hypothetical protein [Microbacterium sp.]|uniref:hypothetical protein n=1 Tax=Microbacterium TaxID=33882 RepID=UPI003241BB49